MVSTMFISLLMFMLSFLENIFLRNIHTRTYTQPYECLHAYHTHMSIPERLGKQIFKLMKSPKAPVINGIVVFH